MWIESFELIVKNEHEINKIKHEIENTFSRNNSIYFNAFNSHFHNFCRFENKIN